MKFGAHIEVRLMGGPFELTEKPYQLIGSKFYI